MALNPKEPFQTDPLISYMSNFSHLQCPYPDFQFRKPPPADVKEAQERSIFDFFISYRHSWSKAYAETLANELREFGYQVYFAGQVLGLEDDQLRQTLRTELHKSSVLTIVGNKGMFDDYFGWVRWEMETFYEGHWGRKAPVITEEMGSPISGDNSLTDYALKNLRQFDTSAAIIYEEQEGAWENQKPSSITIFCLLLVREFYRVELKFWHEWSPMSAEKRYRLYLESLYQDRVCRTIMRAMLWHDPNYSLAQLKKKYLQEAREDYKSTILNRIARFFQNFKKQFT